MFNNNVQITSISLEIYVPPTRSRESSKHIFETLPDLNDIDERNKMLKPHQKILTESKVMHVLKLCKLAN